MINALKGKVSARLLASSSHRPVNYASLLAAVVISVALAVVCGAFAFAQWRVADRIASLQEDRAGKLEERVAAAADMAVHQANAHRATLNCLLARDAQELDEADDLRKSNLKSYSALVAKYDTAGPLHDASAALNGLAEKYSGGSQKIVQMFREGRKEDAIDLRIRELRPTFNQWQEAHGSFTRLLAAEDLEQRQAYDHRIASRKTLLAALLFAPILLTLASIFAIFTLIGIERLGERQGDTWTR